MADYDIRDELAELGIDLKEDDHPNNLTEWVVESITTEVITFSTEHGPTLQIKQTKRVGYGLQFTVIRKTPNEDVYQLAEGDYLADVYPTVKAYMLGWEEHNNSQINRTP